MLTRKLSKKDQGFTIIEVMIVLAIAALILLAVFLAIPNLQRSSRNSGRKADAGRVGTAATNFTGNNNGTLPTTAGDATTVLNDAGTLAQYSLTGAGDGTTACTATAGSANNGKLFICKAAAVTLTADAAGQDGMVLADQGQCGTSGGIIVGTSRQMALLYTVETSSAPTWTCLNL